MGSDYYVLASAFWPEHSLPTTNGSSPSHPHSPFSYVPNDALVSKLLLQQTKQSICLSYHEVKETNVTKGNQLYQQGSDGHQEKRGEVFSSKSIKIPGKVYLYSLSTIVLECEADAVGPMRTKGYATLVQSRTTCKNQCMGPMAQQAGHGSRKSIPVTFIPLNSPAMGQIQGSSCNPALGGKLSKSFKEALNEANRGMPAIEFGNASAEEGSWVASHMAKEH
ncbi:hypothetical protein HPP92_024531 [Vanilla planifolia]|uniref:Uncharacterized protein n=1 Tax=Vanilla planifolia TaxID=51239 RepID=A0A835PL05_VANPL|nr:hypothetical protein HPP92_024531 [Vanilla planifolia]